MRLPSGVRKITDRLPDCLIVGGAVRDWLIGETPKDFDIEVHGVPYSDLVCILERIGKVDIVGKSFGVIKTFVDGEIYDVSIPVIRKADGTGFIHEPAPFLARELASARRDLTINSMGWDPKTKTLFDPFNGEADLKSRLLRHTSGAFVEDPLRVLRCMQFAARFNMVLHAETAVLCQELGDTAEFYKIAPKRITEEFNKFLLKGKFHGAGMATLKETGWAKFFPEIESLYGLEQEPAYRSEGDVVAHTGRSLDALKKSDAWKKANEKTRLTLATAVLCHNMGKACCGEGGHEVKCEAPTRSFMERIGTPNSIKDAVALLVTNQSGFYNGSGARYARQLAMELSPANPHAETPRISTTLRLLGVVVTAGGEGHMSAPGCNSKAVTDLLACAAEQGCLDGPVKPVLSGRDLRDEGIPPGEVFGAILKQSYGQQIDGDIKTKEDALTWLQQNKSRFVEESGLSHPILSKPDQSTPSVVSKQAGRRAQL